MERDKQAVIRILEDHSQCATYTFLHVHTFPAEDTQLIQIIQSSSFPNVRLREKPSEVLKGRIPIRTFLFVLHVPLRFGMEVYCTFASFFALIYSKSNTAADGTGFFLDQVSHRSVIPDFFAIHRFPSNSNARALRSTKKLSRINRNESETMVHLYSRFLEAARAIKKMTGNYCNSYAQIKQVDTKNRQGCTNTAMQ